MLLLLVICIAPCAVGCQKSISPRFLPNQIPSVQITSAPIDTSAGCDPDPARSCYSIVVHWVGYDPDGRVEHFLYAIDPPDGPNADTVWTKTRANEERLLFQAGTVVNPANAADPPRLARDFHVFAIKAIDNRGQPGPVAARAFFSFTVAPTIQIESPVPSPLLSPVVAPSVRIRWSGTDDDGVFTTRPVGYKYILLNPSSEFPLALALLNPNGLRDHYAPDFAGWDSTSAETTEVQFTNLTPDQEYLFVVVAFDEAGAYSPIFTLTTNMLQFKVGYAGQLGPRITVFNEFFEYTWRGGFCPCAQAEVFIEVPAERRITFQWLGRASEGSSMKSFRWALDILDVFDQTPRSDETHDLAHWSAPSLNTTLATLGPFPGGSGLPEVHRFYIEAEDNVGLKSLGIVRFQVVSASLDRPLLIVNDTRGRAESVDRRTGRCRPLGTWPTAAELDTFLFAAGGYPWGCYAGDLTTSPGLFDGYPFEAYRTRVTGRNLSVPLSKLSAYRHVVWITDAPSALIGEQGQEPETALRYMSEPGRFNTLAAYAKQGGQVWLVGGGGAYATTFPWNDSSNDFPATSFKATSPRRELAPGRFMYDFPHWQQDIVVRAATQTGADPIVRRHLGRYQAPSARPDYLAYADELPARLAKKSAVTDPMPPARLGQPPNDFYRSSFEFEYLQNVGNSIIENTSTDLGQVVEESTLDTLYEVRGGSLPPPEGIAWYAAMTYYHGPSVPQGFVFTGFNVWNFQRTQCRELVDFVLRRIWRLESRVASRRVASESVARRGESP